MTDLGSGIRAVSAESGGAINVTIVTPETGRELIAWAALGNSEAATLLRAVVGSAAWIKRAPRDKPTLCMCCPRPIRRVTGATVFGVAAPANDRPVQAIGFAFCDRCGERPSELLGKAAAGLRRIWPDLREIAITHQSGGRA